MTTRGIRNNNPGNLRKSKDQWLGMSKEQNDPSFITFDSMEYGCRALFKTLRTYVEQRGLNTVSEIIRRYAPSNENNTEAYINSVCQDIFAEPDEALNFQAEPELYMELAKAIARHENGKDANLISDADWEKGFDLAF